MDVCANGRGTRLEHTGLIGGRDETAKPAGFRAIIVATGQCGRAAVDRDRYVVRPSLIRRAAVDLDTPHTRACASCLTFCAAPDRRRSKPAVSDQGRHVPDTTVRDGTANPLECLVEVPPRRDGRVVDGGGLENVSRSVIPRRLYFCGQLHPNISKIRRDFVRSW